MSEREAKFPALLAELRPHCERLIAQYERKRSALLPIVHLFQEREGYVSHEAMRAVAAMLDLTPAEVESTVSFYTLFFRRPIGKYLIQVCRGLSCSINGAPEVMARCRERLGVGHLGTTADGLFSYEEVECLAACDRATCAQVNLEFVYDLTPAAVDAMLDDLRAGTATVRPLVQTDPPGAIWSIRQDEQVATGTKALGSRGVTNPNNAGGVGDAAGLIMLDRIVNKTVSFHEATRERAVRDSRAVRDVVEEEEAQAHAGH